MPNQIRTSLPDAEPQAFTLSFGGITDTNGRSSAAVTNDLEFPAAQIFVEIRSGTVAPNANSVYEIYLLRSDSHATSPIRTDDWAGTDAAFNRINADLIGSITVTALTSHFYRKDMETGHLGPLGEEWGIAAVNESGQTVDPTNADHTFRYRYYVPEVQ